MFSSVTEMQELGARKLQGMENSIPVTGNQVEVPLVRATPGDAVSAKPVTYIITLSTVLSKDNALDRPLVDKKPDDPFM